MRLIDVPNGSIFRLHDDFVLKTEYFSRVDDVYIPDCYIIGTGEKFCGGMKTKDDFKTKFNDLEVEVINVLSDVSNTSSVVISQPEPHWIPASERVPEEPGYYITSNEYNGVGEDFYYDGHFWNADKNAYEVIAWMPKPEHYKPNK